ncbi:MAG: hypothetical protein KUG76_02805 [Gammaproteobacteria bacterium]|nr:hypothetical protein [Gammaproteobacteria bacterium]
MLSAPQPSNPGSSSHQPDMDWSQAKETIAMLCLATAQIEAALKDASNSVDELAGSFTKIANDSEYVLKIANSLEQEGGSSADTKQLTESATELHSEIKSSVVAFQFHDRVSQKLSHVNKSLGLVAELIRDPNRLFQPSEWLIIQDEISKSYSLECEKLMFDKIMQGATIEEALHLYENHELNNPSSTDPEDDVELF